MSRKVNLGCGQQPEPGYTNVDLHPGPGVDLAFDLNDSGWGRKLYPCERIISSDVVEHLESCVAFMDECWEALEDGGQVWLKVGGPENPTIWADPTHKRPYTLESFHFFDPDTDFGTRYGQYTSKKWKILELKHDERKNVIVRLTPRGKGPKVEDAGGTEPEAEPEGDGPLIQILVPYRGWCLEDMARRLAEGLTGYRVKLMERKALGADLTYHMPWHTVVHAAPEGLNVAQFTHLNPRQEGGALAMDARVDHITTLSHHSGKVLARLGVPDEKVTHIPPGLSDGFKPAQIRIGINGRPYTNGRKNEDILLRLAWQMDLSPFRFVFIGSSWDRTITGLEACGVATEYHSEPDYARVPEITRTLDYMLSTGLAEGGPRGVQQALACGVPVIGYPVGFVADLAGTPGVRTYTSTEQLRAVLESIADDVRRIVKPTLAWTWTNYVAGHQRLFDKLLAVEE